MTNPRTPVEPLTNTIQTFEPLEPLEGDVSEDAQKILSMIEAVDKDDKDTLDEIDARFWCWLKGKEYAGTIEEHHMYRFCSGASFYCGDLHYWKGYNVVPEYTRSRDALKAARRKHIDIGMSVGFSSSPPYQATVFNWKNKAQNIHSEFCETECLAEMHALVQSEDHERMGK